MLLHQPKKPKRVAIFNPSNRPAAPPQSDFFSDVHNVGLVLGDEKLPINRYLCAPNPHSEKCIINDVHTMAINCQCHKSGSVLSFAES